MSESKSAKYLHGLATHHAQRDWEYTRKTDIVCIRHRDDTHGRNHWVKRWARAFGSLFEREGPLDRMFNPGKRSIKNRFDWKLAMFKTHARKDNNLPDGALNNGTILTYWEEDGEYIQMVQPSVGELLADFLIAEPDHPHAAIITAELDRLLKGHSDRAKAGSVTGGESE